jgi:hypothetical protein
MPTVDAPTPDQAATLDRARYLRDRHGACGIFVNDIGHRSHLRSLERRGWMRFAGFGHDIDGIRDGDLAIYEITPAGEAALDTFNAERA